MAAVCSSSAALVTPVAVQRVQIRKNFAGVKVAQKKAMCKAVFKTQAVARGEVDLAISQTKAPMKPVMGLMDLCDWSRK
eukprot:CAMPEP_0114276002 /NCGR_PEP_ID=MMETSP0059-20121206/1_1 /TAXON_ID=36894 /ORGANISM="Pyramimonas parkeae, Strain CCMP726" /LENGTH=78 /DNA_ID=CAMNT_0001395965 /DNA_START=93 /DNA_END=330 /DNA_ORIENTATION=-